MGIYKICLILILVFCLGVFCKFSIENWVYRVMVFLSGGDRDGYWGRWGSCWGVGY